MKKKEQPSFFEIGCLTAEEQEHLRRRIEEVLVSKKKEGLYTEKEIREIEEMRLRPLPDIQDVQSVYENFLFKRKD
jgi:hypothetical protein